MNLESPESLQILIASAATAFGLLVLSRLLPVFDAMMERPHVQRVTYDICLAVFAVFTLSFLFSGLGFV
jgi:hypothetical protein